MPGRCAGVSAYFSLIVGHVGQAEWQYTTISVPALVDPARRLPLPAVVVFAAPGSTRSAIRSMRLPSTHVQTRQSVVEVARRLLYPEQLCQLIPRVATLERAAIAARLCVGRDIYAGAG